MTLANRTVIATVLLLTGCVLTESCPEGEGWDVEDKRAVGECRPIRNIGMDAGPDATVDDAGADASPDAASDAGPCGLCSGDTPLCRESDGECVACLDDGDCPDERCDTEAGKCVQCLESADCSDVGAPICLAGSCSPCAEASQCEALGAGQNICHEGECVECAPGEHGSCASGRICDAHQRRCVDGSLHSRGPCRPCVADEQCAVGYHCVAPNRFGETGYFCMPEEPETGCVRPFVHSFGEVHTIEGTQAVVCTHATTSCIGYLNWRDTTTGCETTENVPSGDDACGHPGSSDNTRCREFSGTSARCTFSCGSADDCPSSVPGVTCVDDVDHDPDQSYCSFGG